GQEASSHTVCSFCSRRICLISPKREFGLAALTRIQSGFFSVSFGTILIGIRAVLACPFSFTPASRTACLQVRGNASRKLVTERIDSSSDAKIARLRHGEA